MTDHSSRRVRVERGIYLQPNGKYAVCVMVDGQTALPNARTRQARRGAQTARTAPGAARLGELPLSPRFTFAEVAARWLADFEAKVATGKRRDRTLDLYRSQLHRHLLPRLADAV